MPPSEQELEQDIQPLAYLFPEFLKSNEARPLRILAEYLEPLRRFHQHNIQDTVVFFGSARVLSREKTADKLQEAARMVGPAAGDTEQAALKRALKAVEWSRYYEDARELANRLTTWSQGLGEEHHRFVVTSGGGPGIMEAANRGASEAGGPTVGLNIRLPNEQDANQYVTPGLHLEFHYFFMRKFWFAYMAKAMVVFPGGFGTIDEMFEILTLMQTRKLSNPVDIYLYGGDFWNPILNLEPMVEWGAISEEDLSLFTIVNTPDEAFKLLTDRLTKRHLVPLTSQQAQAPGIAATRN